MLITRFGENDKHQWYETPEGRVRCSEETLNKLWWQWIDCGCSRRADTASDTIYEFTRPTEVDLSIQAPDLPYYEP